jgi:hypothetical protein
VDLPAAMEWREKGKSGRRERRSRASGSGTDGVAIGAECVVE